jgi:hypothetical protein
VAEAVRPASGRVERKSGTRPAPFAGRFLAAYAILILAFGSGLLALALLATGNKHPSKPWSAWKPSKTGFAAAGQIAAHVSKQYRLSSNREQLVAVKAYPPEVNSVPLAGIATRDTTPSGLSTGSLSIRDSDHTLVYVFCGTVSQRCMLSAQAGVRDVILRREALELSLYTLKYIHGVDSVVSFLPPPDRQTLWAVYLRRGELRNELRRPLAQTLTLGATPALDQPDSIERPQIDQETLAHWYTTTLQRTPTGRTLLVLDEPVNAASTQ